MRSVFLTEKRKLTAPYKKKYTIQFFPPFKSLKSLIKNKNFKAYDDRDGKWSYSERKAFNENILINNVRMG